MSAIVWQQGQGLKKKHGAKWHCPTLGGFGQKKKWEKLKVAKCDVVKGNVPPKIIAGE